MVQQRWSSRPNVGFCATALVVALLGTSGVARAQNARETVEPALTVQDSALGWFERGLSHSRVQEWAEARAAYLHSLALEPRVSTHFNLAVVSLKLQLGRETLLALDDFAKLADPRLHTQFLSDSVVLRARALDLTGLVELTVSPASALVQVDDAVRVEPASALHSLRLDAGHHALHVSAPGYLSETLELDVALGDVRKARSELALDPTIVPATVALQPDASPGPQAPQELPPTPIEQDDRRWKRSLLWGGVSLLAAGVVAATAALVLHRQRASDHASYGGSTDTVL